MGLEICVNCGKPADTELEVTRDGLFLISGFLCSEHLSDAMAGAAYWRHEFGVLLDRGVSRKDANDQLIARINAGETYKSGGSDGT